MAILGRIGQALGRFAGDFAPEIDFPGSTLASSALPGIADYQVPGYRIRGVLPRIEESLKSGPLNAGLHGLQSGLATGLLLSRPQLAHELAPEVPGTPQFAAAQEQPQLLRAEEELKQAQTQHAQAETAAFGQPRLVADDWKQVPGTPYELNARTGETRQLQGVTIPEKPVLAPKPLSPKIVHTYTGKDGLEHAIVQDPQGQFSDKAFGEVRPLKGGGRSSDSQGDASRLTDQIGTGKIAPERMSYLLARNPALLEDISNKYPDFDSSKVASYASTYKEFTSGQTAKFINAGGTALIHLRQLKEINDKNPAEVRIFGSSANQAYNNLLNTVAGELVRFYGQPETNEAMNAMKGTLGSLVKPRNPAILEQATAMGAKLVSFQQQWENAAPSKAYEAPLPGISEEAKDALRVLSPNYAKKLFGGSGTGQFTASAGGRTYQFPSQKALNAFKKEAGLK